jgi:hypothetical protein
MAEKDPELREPIALAYDHTVEEAGLEKIKPPSR